MITHYCYHFSSFGFQKSRRMTQVARTGAVIIVFVLRSFRVKKPTYGDGFST